MSFAGFRKQINKANQFMSEKIGSAKGTELDDDYVEMERKVDATNKLVTEIIEHTQTYLQPNPASRAKLMTQQAFAKVRGQQRNTSYPQPEGLLGEVLMKNGQELGENSHFGQCCIDTGEAFGQLAEIKDSLEDNVKQNFLEPLQHLQSKDLKEIAHHRKKLAGRRLDYDCKRRKKDKGGQVPEEELQVAENKFEESKELSETSMHNLLSNDVEQISQMKAFVDACLTYHEQSVDILQSLRNTLNSKVNEAQQQPKETHVPKRVASSRAQDTNGKTGSYSFGNTNDYAQPTKPVAASASKTGSCKALYDFEPENEGELEFVEGDIIELTSQIDENWFEGRHKGKTGFFPVNYVEVITPIP